MFKSKKLPNLSKKNAPKFLPGDRVMFVEKPDTDMNELMEMLAKAVAKAGHKDTSKKIKKIKKIKKVQDSGVTCYTTVIFVVQGGEEEIMYGLWGVNGIVRKSESELEPINVTSL